MLDINSIWEWFQYSFMNVITECIPNKYVRQRKNFPWVLHQVWNGNSAYKKTKRLDTKNARAEYQSRGKTKKGMT